jgi:protein-disulfide isomerase
MLHLIVPQLVSEGIAMERMEKSYKGIVSDPTFALWNYQRQPVRAITPRAGEVAEGPLNAPYTAVVFFDFQCPWCKEAHQRLREALGRYPTRLRVVYRHFPMNADCNPAFAGRHHPAACRAALAAESVRAVAGPEAFLRMKSLIFQRQEELRDAPLRAWAEECGVSGPDFDAAFASAAVAAAVAEDVKSGRELPLEGIPAVFLNGKKLEDWGDPKLLEIVLEVDPAPKNVHGSNFSVDRRPNVVH